MSNQSTSYLTWFNKQGNQHRLIVEKLQAQGLDQAEIVAYFDFDNMVLAEPDFCPLYAQKQKCHEVKQLNCYLCACPLFRFNSKGIETIQGNTVYSYCSVNSKFGHPALFGQAIHLDCSACVVPHSKKYVLKHFNENWFASMASCNLDNDT
ncbi:MAG: hypothetical protein WC782_14855 [Methylococcaceae bacterium]|jgi:hypothetical protein